METLQYNITCIISSFQIAFDFNITNVFVPLIVLFRFATIQISLRRCFLLFAIWKAFFTFIDNILGISVIATIG